MLEWDSNCCSRECSSILSRGIVGFPSLRLFRRFHRFQVIDANSSTSLLPARMKSKRSRKEVKFLSVPLFNFVCFHKSSRVGQPYIVWTTSSDLCLHLSHSPSVITLCRTKFTLVDREFLHAFHTKCLTLFGTLRTQILFHKGCNALGSNHHELDPSFLKTHLLQYHLHLRPFHHVICLAHVKLESRIPSCTSIVVS